MCPEPADSSDRNRVPGGGPGEARRGSLPGEARRGSLPDDAFTAGLLDALRSDLTAAAVRRQQVARARRRVEHARLDDAELLEGIATSLLAASDRRSPTTTA